MKRSLLAFALVLTLATSGLYAVDESPIVGRMLDAVSVWIVNGEVADEADPVVAVVKAGVTGSHSITGYKKRGGGKPETWTVVITKSDTPIIVVPPETNPEPKPTTKTTAVIYIYDVRSNTIPPAILAGMNRLNREKKIFATLYEADTTNGKDDVPAQYKLAYDAAKKAGLPSLIVTDGKSVLKVVKDPKTAEQIMESVE